MTSAGEGDAVDAATPRVEDPRIAFVRGRASCYEMDARPSTFMCAYGRAVGSGERVRSMVFVGDEAVMHGAPARDLYPGDRKYDQRHGVVMGFRRTSGYERNANGLVTEHEAELTGRPFDARKHATGEFFDGGSFHTVDRGQSPLFMRREDSSAAALRCGEDLFTFSSLSAERTESLFRTAAFSMVSLPGSDYDPDASRFALGVESTFDEAAHGRRVVGPCHALFGEPTPEQLEISKAHVTQRRALRRQTSGGIVWCLDRDDASGVSGAARELITARMSRRVARDTAELARRLRELEPESERSQPAYPPSELKKLYQWWERLDHDDARLKVRGTRDKKPRYVILAQTTKDGASFVTRFEQCDSPSHPVVRAVGISSRQRPHDLGAQHERHDEADPVGQRSMRLPRRDHEQ